MARVCASIELLPDLCQLNLLQRHHPRQLRVLRAIHLPRRGCLPLAVAKLDLLGVELLLEAADGGPHLIDLLPEVALLHRSCLTLSLRFPPRSLGLPNKLSQLQTLRIRLRIHLLRLSFRFVQTILDRSESPQCTVVDQLPILSLQRLLDQLLTDR